MRYKREEAFRYEFDEALSTKIEMVKKESEEKVTSNLEGKIEEMSPEGARLSTDVDIPEDEMELKLSFKINEQQFYLSSTIVWKKQIGNSFIYGLNHSIDEDFQRELIEEIKLYVRNN